MAYQSVFKRYEIKYLITSDQAERLKELMQTFMRADGFGKSTVCNIYFDTPDYLLIRRSMEKPAYKEKLRLRSYGVLNGGGKVFCELKKKYDSVVYKRRLLLKDGETEKLVFPDTQIGREIAFCFERYENLEPKMFLSYAREAFYARDDDAFRVTFDKNIIWRDYDLSLSKGIYGNGILSKDEVLLEVKTAGAIPLWLTKFLSENKIYKTSFSKYGTAYAAMKTEEKKGGIKSA